MTWVRVARKGDASNVAVGADFGISEQSIYNWVKQADIDDGALGSDRGGGG